MSIQHLLSHKPKNDQWQLALFFVCFPMFPKNGHYFLYDCYHLVGGNTTSVNCYLCGISHSPHVSIKCKSETRMNE
ncbi:hypothetical protein BLOT_002582 [Blomia tropicalis]|nr:hypothetical protein BLOT_002582 [Blomia tropicalis]